MSYPDMGPLRTIYTCIHYEEISPFSLCIVRFHLTSIVKYGIIYLGSEMNVYIYTLGIKTYPK